MILDVVVLAVLLISAVIAFLRGFIREILTILGVLGGLVAAYFGGPLLVPVVRGWFGAKEGEDLKFFDLIPYNVVADAIAYGAVFMVVVIVLSIASHFLSGWAKALGLGAVDRTLGVIFGIIRGVIVLALLYLPVYVMVDKDTREGWFTGSRTHFYVAATADWMMGFLPESLKENAGKKAEEAAESMARTTREKLQELDVLRFDSGSDEAPAQGEPPAGYKEHERQGINRLIRDNMNE